MLLSKLAADQKIRDAERDKKDAQSEIREFLCIKESEEKMLKAFDDKIVQAMDEMVKNDEYYENHDDEFQINAKEFDDYADTGAKNDHTDNPDGDSDNDDEDREGEENDVMHRIALSKLMSHLRRGKDLVRLVQEIEITLDSGRKLLVP